MKKILSLALALLVPALLFLNAWEGYKYHNLADEVASLEKRQKEILEQNMGVIAAIAYERSPERVEQRAAAAGLSMASPSQVTRLVVGNGGAANP